MADKRRYRPGSRYKRFRGTGKQSENRFAWAMTSVGQFIGMIYKNDDIEEMIE